MIAWTPARRTAAWLAAVTAVALVLRIALVGSQPLTDDDRSVGLTAWNFSTQGWPHPTMWNHPRLRDLMVAASTEALGPGPWGLRAWSILLGTLAVPALGLLVLSLGGGAVAAVVASAVVALDPLHVDFSRQAINDVHLSFFPIVAIAALRRWWDSRAPWLLALAGVLLGLGLATKWGAAFPVAAAALAWIVPPVFREKDRAIRAADGVLAVAALALVPLALYVATYWPWFGRGHGLAELAELHRLMALETATHAGYAGTKYPGFLGEVAQAWRWFLQPIWYVDRLAPPAAGGAYRYVVGVANPLAWMAVWPAFGWAGWRALRHRERFPAALILLFVAAYLPFLVVPRPIFTNSAVAVLPFAAALLGFAAERLWTLRRVIGLAWLGGVAVLALALWCPAVGIESPATDRLVRALVAPEAFLPPPAARR